MKEEMTTSDWIKWSFSVLLVPLVFICSIGILVFWAGINVFGIPFRLFGYKRKHICGLIHKINDVMTKILLGR